MQYVTTLNDAFIHAAKGLLVSACFTFTLEGYIGHKPRS